MKMVLFSIIIIHVRIQRHKNLSSYNFYPKQVQWSMRNEHVCRAFNSTILYSHIYMYLCYLYGEHCLIIQIFIKKRKESK